LHVSSFKSKPSGLTCNLKPATVFLKQASRSLNLPILGDIIARAVFSELKIAVLGVTVMKIAMIRLCTNIAPVFLVFWMACSSPRGGVGDYKIALVPSRSGQQGIFVMNSDTTGGKLLTPDPSAQLLPSSWSPDGGKIAFFAAHPGDMDIISVYRIPHHHLLYEMDPAGRNQRRLLDFPVSDFEWSPDGQELLFVSAYEDPEHDDPAVRKGTKNPMSAVYILDTKTGDQRRLTSFGQHCSGSWSPDGSYLALSFGTEKSSNIFTSSPDGQHVRRLTDSQAINLKPKWSPDGKSLVFVSIAPQGEGNETPGVYVIDSAGTNSRRVSDMEASNAHWSPDGKSLLLQSATGLVLLDLENDKTVTLAPRIGRPLDGVFTPDGREVMFRSNHEGTWNLYAVDLTAAMDLNRADIKRLTGRLTASTFCLSPLM
jgi:Tol biopolymer transport system component